MCGVFDFKDMEGSSGYGGNNCNDVGTSDEGCESHSTEEQHREAALRMQDSDANSESAAEMSSEGEIGSQSEDYRYIIKVLCPKYCALHELTIPVYSDTRRGGRSFP